jgi:hypothetical protein
MSDDFKDISGKQHVARALFAIAATALVAAISYFDTRWAFGIG